MASDPAQYKTVTPYEESADKKVQVTKMFDKIAPYYDYLNRLLTVGIDTIWRSKAIKVMGKGNPKKILDIATGTADLAIGDKKLIKKGLNDKITLELGDSENMKYADSSYDVVSSAFGVRNFGDLRKGLTEMYRVLRPGGQIVVLEFSRPKVFPIKQGFNLYFKHILPFIGKIKSKDDKAYKYLYESVQVFPDYDRFTQILDQIGFKDSKWSSLSFGICTIYSATK